MPVHKPSPNPTPSPELGDRQILRALLEAAVPLEEGPAWDVRFRHLAFDPERLTARLLELAREAGVRTTRRLVQRFAADFAGRVRLRVSRTDPVPVRWMHGEVKVPRWFLAELLGVVGTELLPTRRQARQAAFDAAREVAYFGAGGIGEQILPHPVALVRAALAGEEALRLEPVLLEEESPPRRWTVYDLLRLDEDFHRQADGEAELGRFQTRLREDPLDGTTVGKLRAFFDKRATVGLRDTARWALGSRHPWFGWKRAREQIAACFERHGDASFLSPRVSLYLPDLELEAQELAAMQADCQRAAELFAARVAEQLPPELATALGQDRLVRLALAALDCHHDNPDFDLEVPELPSGQTTLSFLGHALGVLVRSARGQEQAPRRNTNLRGHLSAMGVTQAVLGDLAEAEQEVVLAAMQGVLHDYTSRTGLQDATGRPQIYRRPPHILYTFYATPEAQPRDGEELLDSFSLAELQEPQHAQHLRQQPEVFERLVVFFTLVLRHYLDTAHAPDLMPERLGRDFVLLGLWGTGTPNVRVHLFRHRKSGKVRSEVVYQGRSQVQALRPHRDRRHEAAFARLLVNQLGPLVEPSMLRAIGAYLMASEQHREGTHFQKVGALAFARQSLEVFREAARTGIQGALVDTATTAEMLVDNAVDYALKGLDRAARLGDHLPGKSTDREPSST
ncbi:MAG TPA: hypothetical protein PK668_18490 [Myxococcota bacterium]|nr:hypothetical protein [Myxococcota bacterium]HRY97385.1 hypothetical protein [Myxococcota bacterium]HSA23380.1 hypothetical protein [Myxococcota bacterium]